MDYSKLKQLDERTLEKLTEGTGPSDKCLCSLLAPPEEEKRGIRASIKKAFATFGSGKTKKREKRVYGGKSVDIPLTFTKGGNGIYTTKEVIKRKSSCGKCSCDSDNLVFKHSYANIRITAPDIDVSSICSCDSNCFPEYKDKLQSSIKVTVEQVCVDSTSLSTNSEYTVSETSREVASEPLLERPEDSELMSEERQRRPEEMTGRESQIGRTEELQRIHG